MRILIDIGHPAHVHIFKNIAKELMSNGHEVLFTTTDKEYEVYLLEKFELDFVSFGKRYKKILGKIWGLIKFDLLLLLTSIKFRPDIFLSHGSFYASHVAFFMGKHHISLEDSGNMEQINLYKPFTKTILTPDILPNNFGKKQIRYTGYHELIYLHPKHFTPNKNILDLLGIGIDQKYAILRFVSWNATHDKGQKGLTFDNKIELVKLISSRMKLFISSEDELPDFFQPFQIRIPPERMHDALAFATIFVGEGATMASESGILGVASIYINSIVRCYNEDQEKYGTVYNYRDFSGVKEKIVDLLNNVKLKSIMLERRSKLLSEKINVTDFLLWFIENYPNSHTILQENPNYQYIFKNNGFHI